MMMLLLLTGWLQYMRYDVVTWRRMCMSYVYTRERSLSSRPSGDRLRMTTCLYVFTSLSLSLFPCNICFAAITISCSTGEKVHVHYTSLHYTSPYARTHTHMHTRSSPHGHTPHVTLSQSRSLSIVPTPQVTLRALSLQTTIYKN